MLNRSKLIASLEPKYRPMMEMVNIADFYKTIATMTGIRMTNLDDVVMEETLTKWAINKYRFFEMLGNQLTETKTFSTEVFTKTISESIALIQQQFPIYAPWLDIFSDSKVNKLAVSCLSYRQRSLIRDLFPQANLEGIQITHFFKKYLSAPDELVTALGKLYETSLIETNVSISIDPVQIMLASESTAGWSSCYSLVQDGEGNNADGCLGAVLDTSSLVAFGWKDRNNCVLEDGCTYLLKNMPVKKVREFLSISPSFTSVHYNKVYPKDSNVDSFRNLVTTQTQNLIKRYAKKEGLWTDWLSNRPANYHYNAISLSYGYGYSSEFSSEHICYNTLEPFETISVYDTAYQCFCGCKKVMEYSNDEKEWYTGYGYMCENFTERYYCDYMDDYCSYEYGSEECKCTDCWAEQSCIHNPDEGCDCSCEPRSEYLVDGCCTNMECPYACECMRDREEAAKEDSEDDE